MPNYIARFSMLTILIIFVALPMTGCQTAYYKTMEKVGYHKRDIMVDRVEKARDTQEEAKEQFKSALERFSSVLNVKGGDLEAKYKTLNAEFEASEKKAEKVKDRIDSVEDVSEALFAEWEEELKQYSSASLRNNSEKKLNATRKQYKKLITAMKKAEKKIEPVLSAFRDQVLFLKHNLNAQAISSLQSELVSVESDVALLIKEMEKSISEADSFIKTILQE
ncbi:MAG: DUF2959 domain-containing protein [Nitrospira sp.]|nr:DUF2959 domain-containing protein [bacterium]MBL7050495.1 DUF2959 domain-containing protein [Nitrospira sp.]